MYSSSKKEWMRCRIKTRPGSIIPHPHWADKIRPELLDGEKKVGRKVSSSSTSRLGQ